MKTCTQCALEKPLTEFGKDKRQRLGRRPECKECEHKRGSYYLKAMRFRVSRSKWHSNLPITITAKQIEELSPICVGCGLLIVAGLNIHRLDNRQGYTPSNVVKMHKSCHTSLHWEARRL